MEERVARGSGGKGREKSSQQLVSMVEEKARLSGQRRLFDSSSASEVRMAPPLSHTMASGSSPPGRLHGQESEQRDDRSEGELSEEEEPTVPARVNTATAVGIVPSQPGKSITSVSLSGAVQELLGGYSGYVSARGSGDTVGRGQAGTAAGGVPSCQCRVRPPTDRILTGTADLNGKI